VRDLGRDIGGEALLDLSARTPSRFTELLM
jgi:hypothetical protein